MKTPAFSATDLDLLQQQLKSWRQRQPGRPRLPDSLWAAAAALGHAQGVSRVARALGIDFYRLQRQVRTVADLSPRPSIPTGFLELKLPTPPESHRTSTGTIELVAAPTRRLLIHAGPDPAAWVALAEAFWRAHP